MASEETIKVDEARETIARGEAQVIDVRDKESWLDGHVPGSLHVAGDQLEVQLDELTEGQTVIVVGDGGGECDEVASTLRERGYEARVMEGGMKAWKDEKFTLQPSEDPDLEADGPPEDEGQPADEDQPA
jgi:rhodanese-related sulfurtransferase